jgi:phasin family protein
MFPFSQSVTPAVRSHLDAQVSFFNDVSKSLSRSFQNLVDLNIQLTQTLLEESSIAGQQLLTSERPTDAISVAASRAQPATEKLRAYQQHISRVAADAQVELARVAEEHVQETSRTARTLADEVARVASEETERSIRTSQETIRNFRDPFQVDGARRGNGSTQAHGNLQSAGQGSSGGIQAEGSVSVQGGAQGNQAGKGGAGKGAQA